MTPKTIRALTMRLQGHTYAEIGAALEVSRQRAQQMLSPATSVRELVMARAYGRCENCEGDDLSVQVHHRKTEGIAADEYNEPGNLQVLCTSCHRVAHGEPSLPVDEAGRNPHAVSLGRRGGQSTSTAKVEASRANGKRGGRPKKTA